MSTISNPLAKFFGVAIQGQTYLNAVYLLLAFPLGLFYFVFLVTGLSLGIGLLLLWIGLVVLLSVFAAWYGLAAFERWLAISLLREPIPPMAQEDLSNLTLWQKFVATLKNPVTWKALIYLFARFPLGILIFVVFVTLASLSISLIATPFYYNWLPVYPGISLTLENGMIFQPIWIIDTLSEALLVSLAGTLIGLISLHIFNGMAWVSAKFARIMLGNFERSPMEPPAAPLAPLSPEAPESAA
jgi:hypothetical protein